MQELVRYFAEVSKFASYVISPSKVKTGYGCLDTAVK